MAEGGSLGALRARIRAIEGGGGGPRAVAPLGPSLDAALPWGGLPRRALHELGGPAATRVAVVFARALLGSTGVFVWCLDEPSGRKRGLPYAPGLARLGIAPERWLLVLARSQREAVWAFEEALRCSAVACALVELDAFDLAASRRLQLAAETGGGAGLVLRPGSARDPTPNAALTRWWAVPLAGAGWRCPIRLELWRSKGGAPASWTVAYDEQALAFVVAAGLVDRAADAGLPPARRDAAGRAAAGAGRR